MRYAVCNELFGDMEFARSADLLAAHGFHGMEIAPFTVFGDFSPREVESGMETIRKGLAGAGLAFTGLHWLFVKPADLRLTARDPALRRRSWEHLHRLIDIAGELGGGNLIFGSPKQRSSGGIPMDEAMGYYLDGLAEAGDRAAARSSFLLIEPLASRATDVLNTLADAEEVLSRIGRPGLNSMFDFHNTEDETESWDALIRRHAGIIGHVHLNTMDGGWPRPEAAEFTPAFDALGEVGYDGWVSLEIFTVPENPEQVLRDTMGFLNRVLG